MAILRGTDVMRDSSVIPERIGRKGCARRSPRNDKQGEFLRGRAIRDSSTEWAGGPKAVEETALGHCAQNDTA